MDEAATLLEPGTSMSMTTHTAPLTPAQTKKLRELLERQ
jgi:hypothetical protein